VWVGDPGPGGPVRVLAAEPADGAVEALGPVGGDNGRPLLAAATTRAVYCWEPISGRRVDRREWHGPPRLPGLAIAGRTVAEQAVALVAALDRITVWEIGTDQPVCQLPVHARAARSLAVTHRRDGRTLLAAGSYDGAVQLWDLAGGEPLRTLVPHLAPVRAVAVAVYPDDSVVVFSGDDAGTIRVWDADTGALLGVRTEIGGPVTALACHAEPDGTLLVAAAIGTVEHTMLCWATHPAVPAQRTAGVGRGVAAT
jgi:WD40 repeat protein